MYEGWEQKLRGVCSGMRWVIALKINGGSGTVVCQHNPCWALCRWWVLVLHPERKTSSHTVHTIATTQLIDSIVSSVQAHNASLISQAPSPKPYHPRERPTSHSSCDYTSFCHSDSQQGFFFCLPHHHPAWSVIRHYNFVNKHTLAYVKWYTIMNRTSALGESMTVWPTVLRHSNPNWFKRAEQSIIYFKSQEGLIWKK